MLPARIGIVLLVVLQRFKKFISSLASCFSTIQVYFKNILSSICEYGNLIGLNFCNSTRNCKVFFFFTLPDSNNPILQSSQQRGVIRKYSHLPSRARQNDNINITTENLSIL